MADIDIKIFDTHCDTIYECFVKNKSLYDNDLDFSLKKASEYNRYVQVFAIWMPDDLRGEAARGHYGRCLLKYQSELEQNNGLMNSFTDDKRVLKEAWDEDKDEKITAVLAVEGGSVIAGNTDNLKALAEDGVKIITLTWNKENELGCGCFCENDTGLTEIGKKTVAEMNKQNIIVDVSHLSEKGFYDVVNKSKKPFIASHSNAWEVCNNPRNLKKEQIKEIININGLIGLNYYKKFITHSEQVTLDDLYNHVIYFLQMGAQKNLCLGSDFDGAQMPDDLNSADKLGAFYEFLIDKGIPQNTVDDIFWKNAQSFFYNFF